jgi:hypothetical protein
MVSAEGWPEPEWPEDAVWRRLLAELRPREKENRDVSYKSAGRRKDGEMTAGDRIWGNAVEVRDPWDETRPRRRPQHLINSVGGAHPPSSCLIAVVCPSLSLSLSLPSQNLTTKAQ